jgi:alpha-ketoglutarate-dependent taurine dioxygenase
MLTESITCPAGLTASFLSEGVYLPLVLSPETPGFMTLDDAFSWIKLNEEWLSASLRQYGAILFRNLPIQSPEQFKSFVAQVDSKMLPYTMGQSPRKRVLDKVYTSTEFPAGQRIMLHNELSYTHNPPRRIFFYCDTPASEGGETPIADCRTIYQKLDPAIRTEFEMKQVRYVRNMHNSQGFGKSWQQQFETDSKAVVETYLRQNKIDYVWQEDGGLHTFQIVPGVIQHPETHEKLWHSQAHLFHYSNQGKSGEAMLTFLGEDKLPTNAYYGDGTPIAVEVLDIIRQLLWEQATFFTWLRGDVLMVDNFMVCHGRNVFSGERRILVAMTN